MPPRNATLTPAFFTKWDGFMYSGSICVEFANQGRAYAVITPKQYQEKDLTNVTIAALQDCVAAPIVLCTKSALDHPLLPLVTTLECPEVAVPNSRRRRHPHPDPPGQTTTYQDPDPARTSKASNTTGSTKANATIPPKSTQEKTAPKQTLYAPFYVYPYLPQEPRIPPGTPVQYSPPTHHTPAKPPIPDIPVLKLIHNMEFDISSQLNSLVQKLSNSSSYVASLHPFLTNSTTILNKLLQWIPDTSTASLIPTPYILYMILATNIYIMMLLTFCPLLRRSNRRERRRQEYLILQQADQRASHRIQ